MSRFKRIKNTSNKKSSVSIDEKINLLNKELEKTGMLSEIVMTTDTVYSTSTYVPPQERIESDVPDTSGITDAGFNQSSAGSGTEGDAPTFSSTADLFNTTVNATIFPSTNYEGAQGYGIVIGPSFGAGTSYGIIEGGNTYRQVLGAFIAGGTRGPNHYKDIYINKQHANVDNPGTYTPEQIADAKEDWQLAVQVDAILTDIGYDNSKFNVTWKAYRPNRLFEDLSAFPSYNHPTKGLIYLVPFSMLGTKNRYTEQEPRRETTTNPQRRGLEDEPIYPGPIPPGLWPPLSPGGFNWLKKKALTASADPNIAFFGNKDKDKGIDPNFFKGTTKNILLKYASQIVNDLDWNGKLRQKFNKLTNGRITPEKFMELYPKLTNPTIKETEFNRILDDANKSSSTSGDGTNVASSGVNYDVYNWILKTYDGPAANWYEQNPTLPHESNPHIPTPEAPYIPLAVSPFAGAKDGDKFAFFGGDKNKTKTTKKPTKQTYKGKNDAVRASTGMYPSMTPEIFLQKYGMSWNEYLNLP